MENNKRLAVLLGIEPKSICPKAVDLYVCGDGEDCIDCKDYELIECKLPDFQDPENFVKLQEINYKIGGMHSVTDFGIKPTRLNPFVLSGNFKEDWLTLFTESLELMHENRKKYQQQAQTVNFKY